MDKKLTKRPDAEWETVMLKGKFSTEGLSFSMAKCPDCNTLMMVPVEHPCEENRQTTFGANRA